MVLSSNTYHTGQMIPWKNGTAEVVRHNTLTNKVLISFNGKQEWVDFNDIFGVNKENNETLSYLDQRIQNSESTIERYDQIIADAKAKSKLAIAKISDLKACIRRLLGGSDVESLSAEKQKKYLDYQKDIRANNSTKWRADADVHSYVNLSINEILYKGDLQNQQSLANSILA